MASSIATLKAIDWTLCCLCQSKKAQPLQKATEKGFTTLERDLQGLDKLGALPFGIDLRRLDDGTGISCTLVTHKSVYHKLCRSACNSIHVKCARDIYEQQKDCGDAAKIAGYSPKKIAIYLFFHTSETRVCCV